MNIDDELDMLTEAMDDEISEDAEEDELIDISDESEL